MMNIFEKDFYVLIKKFLSDIELGIIYEVDGKNFTCCELDKDSFSDFIKWVLIKK